MNHWVAAPVLLPALLAALMIPMGRAIAWQRVLALILGIGLAVLALWLYRRVPTMPFDPYLMGNWIAPFGIVLMLDRLSAVMILLSASLSLPVLIHAIVTGQDRRAPHFHPLLQFQIMGINGAILTGDIFNLFVFFEVMLIASYGLLTYGGGAARLRAGLHYVVLNLIASALFLIAAGLLYAVTGTLNMADLAEKVVALPVAEAALLRAGAMLLLLVFAMKAALVPLHLWQPLAYAAAPGVAGAMLALMTKVGAYALLRSLTLLFPDSGATAGLADLLMPAALLTLALGALGSLAARSLPELRAQAALASSGTVIIGLALMTGPGITAGLTYLIQSTLALAGLFLLGDLIGPAGARRWGGLFLALSVALVGLPPFLGFVAKLMLLRAALADPLVWWIWATVLGATFAGLVAFARMGSRLYWSPDPLPGEPEASGQPSALALAGVALLIGLQLALIVKGESVTFFLGNTALQLAAPQDYIDAVLGARN